MRHHVCMKDLPCLMTDEHVPEVKLVILPSFTVKCSKIQIQAKCNSPRLNWAAASGLKYVMQWSCNTCNCSGLQYSIQLEKTVIPPPKSAVLDLPLVWKSFSRKIPFSESTLSFLEQKIAFFAFIFSFPSYCLHAPQKTPWEGRIDRWLFWDITWIVPNNPFCISHLCLAAGSYAFCSPV